MTLTTKFGASGDVWGGRGGGTFGEWLCVYVCGCVCVCVCVCVRARVCVWVSDLPSGSVRPLPLIQRGLYARFELGPVGVEPAHPARAVAAEQPDLLLGVVAVTALAFAALAFARLLEAQVPDEVAPERGAPGLLDVQEDEDVLAVDVERELAGQLRVRERVPAHAAGAVCRHLSVNLRDIRRKVIVRGRERGTQDGVGCEAARMIRAASPAHVIQVKQPDREGAHTDERQDQAISPLLRELAAKHGDHACPLTRANHSEMIASSLAVTRSRPDNKRLHVKIINLRHSHETTNHLLLRASAQSTSGAQQFSYQLRGGAAIAEILPIWN